MTTDELHRIRDANNSLRATVFARDRCVLCGLTPQSAALVEAVEWTDALLTEVERLRGMQVQVAVPRALPANILWPRMA